MNTALSAPVFEESLEHNLEQNDGSAAITTPTRKAAGAFRTIGEVAALLNVEQHVLRFWETKFSQIRPVKRGGGRRYYRPEDVALLTSIHKLLYAEGYTIKGVQKLLRENSKSDVIGRTETPAPKKPSANDTPPHAIGGAQREVLAAILAELKALRAQLAA